MVEALLEKIRKTPTVKTDKPETFLEFSAAVRNASDYLRVAELEEHLSNPTLIEELVNRLPGHMKKDWAIACTRQHHPLLHQSDENEDVFPCNHSVHIDKKGECLFRIMPVTLYRGDNQIDTCAFIDEGSSLTLMETSLAKELGG
uniref:Uncharacterized protein n=1 Tax=Anopheles epiroticus TaxID=199890 RepID=A0A182PWT0_9DIPT